MTPAYIVARRARLIWCFTHFGEGTTMRLIFQTMLAAAAMTLALGGCKDSRVNATPSGAGNSESGASGGSAAAPGVERGNTGNSSDSPAATAPGTTNGAAGTPTTTGGNPTASGQQVTPPPDGKTNTTR